MPYLIGTDEAGYGPNLGPLVVAASVWQVADFREIDLYQRLSEGVTAEPAGRQDLRLHLADSKQLYQAGGSWEQLEAGLWPLFQLLGDSPASMRQVWSTLAQEDGVARAFPLWRREFDLPLPRDACLAASSAAAARLAEQLAVAGVRLVALRCRTLFPLEFNAAIAKLGNKGTALSHVTLELVASLMAEYCPGPVQLSCDKHGGRNRYAALLQHFFTDSLIETFDEGRDCSRYGWGSPGRRVQAEFRVGGESWLPSAVASMAAKYLRELAMLAFNDFWSGHLPGLRPTAGYPVDARRFRGEIAQKQQELGIGDAQLWRQR